MRVAEETASNSLAREEAGSALIAFRMHQQPYALALKPVGEIANPGGLVTVPGCHPAILGIFSLRGNAVPVVSLGRLLELEGYSEAPSNDSAVFTILREGEPIAALQVDSIVGIVRSFTSRSSADEAGHPAVAGFATVEGETAEVLTVLDVRAVEAALDNLKL